ncbi:MAG TPA: hypothetical protein VK164_02635 [Flavobacterium sp.]|uniref:hypothetical protein n=1 Tax=Flavobacterium sp. TaxID=239 RepID=UPI002B4B165D|nr:hypothetical protein [Flavobacterium sp.]HLO72807.1 hypothetical protein [Flavobacterium sp.]
MHKSFNELLKDQKFSKAYNKVQAQKNNAAKTVMEEQYQFTIADKPVKIVQSENGTTYTLLINRAIDDANTFENLVIKYENDGSINATIINYQPFYPLNTMDYFTNSAFNGLQSVTPIVYNDALVSTTGKISSDCYSVCTILCHDLTESGPYSVPHPPGTYCTGNNVTIDCVVTCWGDNIGGEDTGNDIGTVDNTSGGGTSSSTNSGNVSTPPNNCGNCNNPIETIPVLELGEEEEVIDPCTDLKNKFVSNRENIKPIIDSLKTFLNEPDERGVSFKVTRVIEQPDNYEHLWEVGNGNTAPVSLGGLWYGSIHTHPFGYDTMFSWQDVDNLLSLYQGATVRNKALVFNMVVSSSGDVYCIKVDNIVKLKLQIENDWNIPELADCEDSEKNAVLLEMMQIIYSSDSNSERAFLKKFSNYGISLYKADSTLTNWSKLSLTDPVSANSIVNNSPCN